MNDIDEDLIKRIGNDDMEALDIFYCDTERILYAYILALSKNHDMTIDIMQDTYIKLISASHLYKPMGKPLAWLFTIAKNLYYTKIKTVSRETNLEAIGVSGESTLSQITDLEDKMVLEEVMRILTEEERQIVILYAVSGMKHKEIAVLLDLKLSTTLSKYHRAIKKLRKNLEKRGISYDGK
ncbi:RNA polymerase sigma factor [Alkaliphilus oremlandii]|uniref:RNA polymerase sigma factor n=1 Tax=Alkaliphilus oremlandii TaxID=461876 RepID=UPI001F613066|nr:RNA polymerase sigma factor [Alkaliphilus oremlandii]